MKFGVWTLCAVLPGMLGVCRIRWAIDQEKSHQFLSMCKHQELSLLRQETYTALRVKKGVSIHKIMGKLAVFKSVCIKISVKIGPALTSLCSASMQQIVEGSCVYGC